MVINGGKKKYHKQKAIFSHININNGLQTLKTYHINEILAPLFPHKLWCSRTQLSNEEIQLVPHFCYKLDM